MGLEKGIKYGKEHRKSYEGTNKAIAASCRNHGTCSWCMRNRMHKFRDKHPRPAEDALEIEERGCENDGEC